MLQRLSVRNYALIEELQIDFGKGLTIITGETGAGKSILLGAMHLLLGERADPAALLRPDKKCIVEGTFLTEEYDLHDFFRSNDLDEEQVCILRREVNPNGKSRAFINDTPVNLLQLKELAGKLVDIHSQHDTLLLETSAFQLQLLDASANNQAHLKKYRQTYYTWKNLQKEIAAIQSEEDKSKVEQDFIQFQFNELSEARLQPGEFEKLETEFNTLDHAEEIRQQVGLAIDFTEGENHSVLAGIRNVMQALQQISRYSPEGEELQKRMDSLYIELKDVLNEMKLFLEKVGADPARLSELTRRLDVLNHLLGKHRVQTTDELIIMRESFEERLSKNDNLSKQLVDLTNQCNSVYSDLQQQAKAISERRRKSIPSIEKETRNMLRILGMPKSTFRIGLHSSDEPGIQGIDRVTILFSANEGSKEREIQKVASGGELSRLMLAIKKIIAGSVALPTIIFDEIDTGVSGALADSMGDLLKDMSAAMQVIAITHLPQIASKGTDHLKVVKTTIAREVRTGIKRLNQAERIDEIAAMLSGKELSGAAISNAKTLLGMSNG